MSSFGSRPSAPGHAHRNSFSAAYASYFTHPPPPAPQNPYRSPARPSSMDCPWPVYALDWSRGSRPGSRGMGRIALGSFSDDMGNRLQVVGGHGGGGGGDDGVEIHKVAEVDATLPYPVMAVMWEPPRSDQRDASMIATCGDYLRIFSVGPSDGRTPGKLVQEVLLGNTKTDFPAPLTSFDWNKVDTTMIVTASVDTTCTVWDINTAQARTQLIAHDKEVFDVTFTADTRDVFASVGSDGSVRLFDLRALEHSTILYESPSMAGGSPPTASPTTSHSPSTGNPAPLLRISACERDPNLLATFAADSNVIQVLDIRRPGSAMLQLESHTASVNAIKWAPNSRNLIASAADDCQVFVWDCNAADQSAGVAKCREPVLAWTAESEVNNISWNSEGDRLCAAFGKTIQVIKF